MGAPPRFEEHWPQQPMQFPQHAVALDHLAAEHGTRPRKLKQLGCGHQRHAAEIVVLQTAPSRREAWLNRGL
jgi:hypothetical protein